jgi:hypothetical protein
MDRFILKEIAKSGDKDARIRLINLLIKEKKWDEAFEWVKIEVHLGSVEGAELTFKISKMSKYFEKGIILLGIQSEKSQYKKALKNLNDLFLIETSRLTLWSKIPDPDHQDDLEGLTTETDSFDDFPEDNDEIFYDCDQKSIGLLRNFEDLLAKTV